MDELMTTGFGFEFSSRIQPNTNFDKPVEKVIYVDDSNRIDNCNLPE